MHSTRRDLGNTGRGKRKRQKTTITCNPRTPSHNRCNQPRSPSSSRQILHRRRRPLSLDTDQRRWPRLYRKRHRHFLFRLWNGRRRISAILLRIHTRQVGFEISIYNRSICGASAICVVARDELDCEERRIYGLGVVRAWISDMLFGVYSVCIW